MKKMNKVSLYLFYIFFASSIFSNTISQGIAIVIIILWIIKWIATRRFIRTPLDLPVLIYLFIRMVTCFTSVDVLLSLKELRSGIFFSLIYFALTNLNDDEQGKAIYHFITIIIYAGVVAALYGIFYVAIHHFSLRAQSTAGGISRFSEYMMISFCLSFALAHNRKVFPQRVFGLISIVLIALGLLFAEARAQWLGIIPVIIVVGIKQERSAFSILIVIFATVIGFVSRLRKRFLTLLHPMAHTAQRLIIWKQARLLIFNRPLLGFGPRTYSVVSPVLKDRGTWHSDYLQVYMDSGIFGFLSYAYLSYMIFKYSILLARNRRKKELGLALLFTMLAMYIVSFFGGHIQEPVITPLFFSLIGFISIANTE
ncbi:MAG: hypothetical protein B5M53_02100 [Candidatus Cloacimonas sp. 4484_209]|nr:MAG: hypothetical protein B5M53_02100 [Candidatus Cloacimonas sp. 4484_209]